MTLILRINKTSVVFNIKMATAPILKNCTDRVLIAGGRVDKRSQSDSPSNEVIDIDDPTAKCHYRFGDKNAFDNFGLVGGLLGPHAIPILCGGLDVGGAVESKHQLVNFL